MAVGTPKRLAGPSYLANSATNIYNPASGIVANLRQIHLANKTGSAATYSLYIGATGGSAGGTELAGAVSLAANSCVDLFFADLVMKNADFLSGLSGTASAIVVTVIGLEKVID